MFNVKIEFGNTPVPCTIRFTEAMLEELRQTSQEKNISFNRLALECFRYALDNLEDKDRE